ncbi:hypothetical protein O3P69_019698 [Scylla paramamosain]|uniref:t-SNARE coiled-coil homology domain-containing protein n=1 Tax=Scylla paramamosain TaxID=85552 RepID=A0AAW0SY13_SCYPA
MATLMTEFQQQFATVTADITHKICQIATREEPEQRTLILEVEKLVDEAKELLERMELEVELRRLEAECGRVRASAAAPGSSVRDELLGGGEGVSAGLSAGEEQRQALLDNTETLERTSARLTQGHKIALETEHIGAQILNDLHGQRQTLSHARQRLRETDSDLDQSSRVLGSMLRRTLQNRFVLYVAVGAVVVVILIAIYVEIIQVKNPLNSLALNAALRGHFDPIGAVTLPTIARRGATVQRLAMRGSHHPPCAATPYRSARHPPPIATPQPPSRPRVRVPPLLLLLFIQKTTASLVPLPPWPPRGSVRRDPSSGVTVGGLPLFPRGAAVPPHLARGMEISTLSGFLPFS